CITARVPGRAVALPDLLTLFLAGWATALATGLGAIPVFILGKAAERLHSALVGLAIGLMSVASIVGLLEPALHEGSVAEVLLGLCLGVFFLLAARRVIGNHEMHVGQMRGAGVRTSVLVFAVLFVHSLPEGLAIGTAYASNTAGLSLFVIAAIALQNVPEGTAVAVPMQEAGFGNWEQFWAAVLTSTPQPFGAVLAYLLVQEVQALLPVSFAFAAGAMLALVAWEMVPEAFTSTTWRGAGAGTLAGAACMLVLSAVLGV
ncbi:MAG: ZIP family metal transporter, partial [Chloroflexota bacterium]|nr:ZIP family metal transporter [Chloroflexota bacterium]